MIPVYSQTVHRPDDGKYGDCLRACVASILELGSPDVPHFFENGATADQAHDTLKEFLSERGYAPFYVQWPGSMSFDDVMGTMKHQADGVHYALFGSSDAAEHVVVCCGGKRVHDPSWYGVGLVGPSSDNTWTVLVIAKK